MSKSKSMSLHKLALISFVVIIIGMTIMTTLLKKQFKEHVEMRFHKHLDAEFIIESDTLRIVDYSVLQDNFTLSNGQNISAEIVNSEFDK